MTAPAIYFMFLRSTNAKLITSIASRIPRIRTGPRQPAQPFQRGTSIYTVRPRCTAGAYEVR